MNFHYNKETNLNKLAILKGKWYANLTTPQDGMWESFIDNAIHWNIQVDNQTVGYACVNDENRILQFFISPQWMHIGVLAFQEFINDQKISECFVGTNNPIFLTFALHIQRKVEIDTYLFMDSIQVDTIDQGYELSVAESKDLENLVGFCHQSMDAPISWLRGYLGNLIERQEIFALKNGMEIIGTCEVRKSKSQPEIADIGMIVSVNHRKKGIGTYLLGKAKEIAYDWNRKPICSCEKNNIGSLKSIHNSGFRSMHQILKIKF